MKLASEFGCSNSCSFRDMTFFYDFFQNFSENLSLKIFKKLEFIIFLVRLCRGTRSSCEFFLQIGLLKILQFSRYDGFCDISKKKFMKIKYLNFLTCSWGLSE